MVSVPISATTTVTVLEIIFAISFSIYTVYVLVDTYERCYVHNEVCPWIDALEGYGYEEEDDSRGKEEGGDNWQGGLGIDDDENGPNNDNNDEFDFGG